MMPPLWKEFGLQAFCGTALLTVASLAQAQVGVPSPPPAAGAGLGAPTSIVAAAPAAPVPASAPQKAEPSAEEMKARIDRLEKQIEALLQTKAAPAPTSTSANTEQPPPPASAGALSPQDVQKIIGDYLSQSQAKAKQDADTQQRAGINVGSNLGVTAQFAPAGYLFLSTPNRDFTMHIGGWFQYDNVAYSQSPILTTRQGAPAGPAQFVASGARLGGIGNAAAGPGPQAGFGYEDGTYWRRIRPLMEGTFFENGEYRFNIALENDQFSTSGLDEFWMGWNNLPLLGTVRVGHVKTPSGLEADMTASSRAMTFMERSSYSEAIEQNTNFVTGLWLGNAYFDQRTTWQASAFRTDTGASTGTFFGDGQWGAQGRLTALPIYCDDGRNLMHVAVSGGWRNGTANLANSSLRTFQLQARPELRDDDPAAGNNGVVPNSNSNRMISTGNIVANNMYLLGLEFLYIKGPFSVQAEWGWNHIQDAIGTANNGFAPDGTLLPASMLVKPTNYTFSGGYLQVAYTLTGENRAYDKQIGTLARYYYGARGPINSFFFVRGEDGRLNWNTGAWEIAARVSRTDLNDGVGTSRIQGGIMDGASLGLNWYLNTNLSVMFDYVHDMRYDLPIGSFGGVTNGFGMRVQMSF